MTIGLFASYMWNKNLAKLGNLHSYSPKSQVRTYFVVLQVKFGANASLFDQFINWRCVEERIVLEFAQFASFGVDVVHRLRLVVDRYDAIFVAEPLGRQLVSHRFPHSSSTAVDRKAEAGVRAPTEVRFLQQFNRDAMRLILMVSWDSEGANKV